MSLFTIAVVGSLIGGGVVAYFSDTEVSGGNVFAAGTIDINLEAEGGGQLEPMNVGGLKPCDWVYYKFVIHNVGNNHGPAYIHLFSGTVGTPIQGYNKVYSEAGDDSINNIEKWITVDLKVNGVVIIPPEADVRLRQLDCTWLPVGWLKGYSDTIVVELSFHLHANTPNAYQGDAVDFAIEAMMTDHNAPPPADNIMILENKDQQWQVVTGDGVYGVAAYAPGSLSLMVYGYGLTPNTDYQIAINSPEVATWFPVSGGENHRQAMASALASNVYNYGASAGTAPPSGFNIFERGYYDISAGGNLLTGPPTPWQDDIIGKFVLATAHGASSSPVTTDASGDFIWAGTCDLPSGAYEYIKVLVNRDVSPWLPALMERDTTMFFTIP
jgi:predicted ribosomally synthesized peptide with SipW-like signal peptide